MRPTGGQERATGGRIDNRRSEQRARQIVGDVRIFEPVRSGRLLGDHAGLEEVADLCLRIEQALQAVGHRAGGQRVQHSSRDQTLRHAFRSQNRAGIREALERGRRGAGRAKAVRGVLQREVCAVRVDAVAHCDAGWVDEALFEIIDVQQHVDGVELDIDVELIQDVDRDVVLGRGLDVQRGAERTQIARGQTHVTGRADLAAFLAEFLVVLTVEFVRQHAHVRQNRESPIGDLADCE